MIYELWGDLFNNCLAYFFIALCSLLPFAILIYLFRNFSKVHNHDFKLKYGKLYEKLKVENGQWVLAEPLVFFLRRYI